MNPETLTREKEGPQLHQPLSGTLVCTARARADWGAAAQFTNVPLFGCCIADFCSLPLLLKAAQGPSPPTIMVSALKFHISSAQPDPQPQGEVLEQDPITGFSFS